MKNLEDGKDGKTSKEQRGLPKNMQSFFEKNIKNFEIRENKKLEKTIVVKRNGFHQQEKTGITDDEKPKASKCTEAIVT